MKYTALAGAAVMINGCQTARHVRPSGELHVALLSDTHIPGDRQDGYRGFNPWTNLQSIVPQIASSKPEGVILNGDAARMEGRAADYQELKSLLAPVAAEAPVLIGLGNHDDRGQFAKVFSDAARERQPVKDKHVVIMDHPAVRIVVLDSLLYVNKVAGLLGSAKREWLARYLAEHRDRPTVFFVHHTLGDGDSDLLDAGRLFELIRPHRHVKAVFYGHSHVWSLGERDRVKMINLPAVGYNFSDNQPVGWVDARFHRSGVRLTLHAFAGNRSQDGEIFSLAWS